MTCHAGRSLVIVFWLSLACAVAAAAAPATVDDSARLDRGEQVRQVLLQVLERDDGKGDPWPSRLDLPADGPVKLVYTRPQGLDVKDAAARHHLACTTVVVHEPLENYPGGVWVGYADGHLEFAASAEALAACEAEGPLVRAAIEKFGNPNGAKPTRHMEPASVAEEMKRTLTIKVVDPDGKPVAGALAGVKADFSEDTPAAERVIFVDKPKDRPMVTDDRGELTVAAGRLFSPTGAGSLYLDLGAAPLVIVHEGRALIALEELHPGDFGGGGAREVRLRPACRINADVTSLGFRSAGKVLEGAEGFAMLPGHVYTRALYGGSYQTSSPGRFGLVVPPGDYAVYFAAGGHDSFYRYVRVEPGRREYRLAVDLPVRVTPDRLAGKPAPEFTQIKGWKNGGPVKLADLRGKVVLLDFWGYWCGPCVGAMPNLMKLHDKYKDRGLVVVAVHDDSVASIEEMDAKLVEARKFWGRDLPFVIALDGGGQTRVRGSGQYVAGATTAAYLVPYFPTTVLVGRDGKVVKQVSVQGEEDYQALDKLLETMVDPAR
jgi:thiol-disulfide isomerase/thioredoxin